MKLYQLREVIESAQETKAYNDAKNKALNDTELQILFGELDRCNEMNERFGTHQTADNQVRMQQIKMKIFANENYQHHKQTEKELNQLRYNIAKRIFPLLDKDMYIEGLLGKGGSGKCG